MDRLKYGPFNNSGDAISHNRGRKLVYGDFQGGTAQNQRGRLFKTFDQAGVVTNAGYNFKGQLIHCQRQLAVEYKEKLNWSNTVPLEQRTYATTTKYNALNREIECTTPDNTIIQYGFNERGF